MTRKQPSTVLEGVELALRGAGETSWRTVLARTLASALDDEPNASMARELRALMAAIDADAIPKGATDVADDLRARRAQRVGASADARELAAGAEHGRR